jgi:hypothetical protein
VATIIGPTSAMLTALRSESVESVTTAAPDRAGGESRELGPI